MFLNILQVWEWLTSYMQKIYGERGRIFWVHNAGSLGCLPYFLDRFLITAGQMDKYGCASPFNEAAQYLNLKLKEALAQNFSSLKRKCMPKGISKLGLNRFANFVVQKYTQMPNFFFFFFFICTNAQNLYYETWFLKCWNIKPA